MLWAIGRLGARVPLYGPLNTVVPAETAADWLTRADAAEKGTGPICAKHPEGRSGKLDLSPFPPNVNWP